MAKPVLRIIIGSTRPGRVGPAVAGWIAERAREHGGFDVQVTDLAALNLPILDEPNHPRLHQYVHQHTKDWSALVEGSDAFIFVTPEYNYAFNAALKNAIDYLHGEWQHKPAGIVSYGGVAAGTRAAQMLKQVITTLRVMPVPEAVRISTSFWVRKTSFSPEATSVITCFASAERWWITGRASSRSTSSGTIAGPGVINRGLRISRILGRFFGSRL